MTLLVRFKQWLERQCPDGADRLGIYFLIVGAALLVLGALSSLAGCTSTQVTGTFRIKYFLGWAYDTTEIRSGVGGFDDWQGPLPPEWVEPTGFPWGWLLAGVGALGLLLLLWRYGLLRSTAALCTAPVRAVARRLKGGGQP